MITNTFVVIRDEDGTVKAIAFDKADKDSFFTTVSKHYAFDDCSGEAIMAIYYEGKEVQYVGWQPCMKFEYEYLNGNTIWVGEFPQWDH